MKLTRTIIAICLCMVAVAGFAQKATNNPFFRFATKAEAQMLITDIDEYTNGWNQFDICSRLQNKEGRKSQLLTLAMSSVQNWSDTEKKKATNAFNAIVASIKKQKLALSFPDEIILKPHLGAYNLHGALLPKYRGQTCVNWAVVNGEKRTGATLHLMTAKADEGDIVEQRGFDIAFTDTSLDVFIKISKIASEIIKDCLPKIEAGTITLTPQDDTQATKFGRRRPKDGLLDFSKDAISLYNLIRGVTHPFPGAFTYVNNKKLFIWWAKPIEGTGNIGEIVSTNPLCIGTGKGLLQLEKLQFENEAELDAKAFTDLLPIGTKFELE